MMDLRRVKRPIVESVWAFRQAISLTMMVAIVSVAHCGCRRQSQATTTSVRGRRRVSGASPAYTESRPFGASPVRLVSATAYPSLAVALEQQPYLYIPPGNYTISGRVTIANHPGGVILGGGRLATRIQLADADSGVVVTGSPGLLIADVSIVGRQLRSMHPALDVEDERSCGIALISSTIEAGSESALHDGGIGVRLRAPGRHVVQGCHVIQGRVGLSVENPDAVLSVMGGDYASNGVHIREIGGRIEVRSAGFQLALDGTDIEIAAASSQWPHLIEGCRSEGPGGLIRVPAGGPADMQVVVLSNGLANNRYVVEWHGRGHLTVLGNHTRGTLAATAGAVQSWGNLYAGTELMPFDISGDASLSSTGDLWFDGQHHGTRLDSGVYSNAGVQPPHGVTFVTSLDASGLPHLPPPYRPVMMPVVENVAELMPDVRRVFHARGDGHTDDSQAIREALEHSRGGALYFPAGRYLVDSPVVLDHWLGGLLWGDGPDRSILASTTARSVLRTNSCGYLTVVGLGFETAQGATEPSVDLTWDGSPVVPPNGAALQANMFYRCAFRGGSEAVNLGRGGYMGSEHLFVDSSFTDAGTGLAVSNYNALTNTVIDCRFSNLDYGAAQQPAGSFNLFGSTLENIRRGGLLLRNSASDTIAFSDSSMIGDVPMMEIPNNTGAPIFVLLERARLASRSANPASPYGVLDRGGGVLTLLDSQLGQRRIVKRAGLADASMLVIDTPAGSSDQIEAGARAQAFTSVH